MVSTAWARRKPPRPLPGLCGALGLCGLAFLAALSVSVGAQNAGGERQREPAEEAAAKPEEAPTGFDNKTNGLEDQHAFDKDRAKFEEVEQIKDGLGPVYNAPSCVSCHQNPVTGSSSQTAEIRSGHHEPDPKAPGRVRFVPSPGGSLIHQRAIDPAVQDHVLPEEVVRTLRMSTNILGDGFVEVIPDQAILDVQKSQERFGLRGFAVVVKAVVERKKGGDGKAEFTFAERIGRFGWKCQEASLLNFSAGAYLNEIGITSPLQPEENLSNGRDVSRFDTVADPEDKEVDEKDPNKTEHPFGVDVEAFARFMRSTKAPPRDPGRLSDLDVAAGERLFRDNETLGCAVCHHPDYTTPPAGEPIVILGTTKRGSDMPAVPKGLGNRVIHPYSDFLLHNIGTGDGIAQTQHAQFPPRGAQNVDRIPAEDKARPGLLRPRTVRESRSRQAIEEEDTNLEQRTANMIRTAPLWGLRVRPQLMHDGLSLTVLDAIRRHKGQAAAVTLKFEALSAKQKRQLLAFLNSL
jgi:CxxC motif-containing protein (DUF1111 family)